MIEPMAKKVFEGLAYTIWEDDEASVVLLEGKPIQASCVEHGNHNLFDLDCPHVEKLLKKIFS
ncbi:hypothetical protein SULI_04795 [Saccharolobus solfataricus]|uniref:Uncharacterized protein n=2 Tax=Saccharolobus solfataricus TaxID=2287 RepID=A0A0E3GT74_SACSO|nr:hypothetical protein [Saccharolobus solfataricus]AKA73326.1 hypothetical protein SULB_0979 [Saccharolobus solfataricus]AKA76025.1 hypothetical protein SULC_0978 [Saccharolobus solfataricus]AKA78718.1 hypothetical protein SULA_0977 [Saccharolobus solfataricus]AZF67793.1 hypothetical protein SULG_04795 [Saccharolobus solfataricus]AZF70413.1 hypothetical protein SULH_04795 [Saccharolobus solfataricus]